MKILTPEICKKLTMRITEPWKPELSEKEGEQAKEDEELLEFLGIKKKTPSGENGK